MSCNSSQCNEINVSHCPGEVNTLCLFVGSTKKQSFVFKNQDGTAIPITGDTFTMVIKNGGTTVATLTIGSGLAISGTNTLIATYTAPVTADDGVYNYILDWSRASTGESFPVLTGVIEVKPRP